MISVLMSIYNETLAEIRESVDSILAQSFTDFELIIVLDQPSNIEGLALLQEYERKDKRIRILVNEKNIGLALSMNYAAKHAKGKYFLRMDADDICMPGRFQLEYDAISGGKYDLVCGNYDFIDESGMPLHKNTTVYTERQISMLLPLRNVIHHPTVIMTSDIFFKVGGYRNFSCAQDYDLWLRMKCAGARMYMLSEKLIQYRMRPAGTTLRKRYTQSCTGDYIRMLYRQKNSMNGYSYEGYLTYLNKRHANEPFASVDFVENFNRYLLAKQELKRGCILSGMMDFACVFFKSKYYRPNILRSLQIAVITKFMN